MGRVWMNTVGQVRSRLAGLPVGLTELARTLQLMAELRSEGWHRSINQLPTNGSGEPVPWITYPAMHWLDRVLAPHHTVFEFGSGGSTLFLAGRVARIVSVEHDAAWAETVRSELPTNAELRLATTHDDETILEAGGDYTDVLVEQKHAFDLIVVDGRARNACVHAAMDSVAQSGIILLDDADRPLYRPSHDLLSQRGFGRLDFFGPKPGLGFMSLTSVFSRDFTPWLRGLAPPPPTGH
jgi:Methyltransferase domain